MDIEKYIASGILERYQAGALSEEENIEVADNAKKYSEIKKAIEALETSIPKNSKVETPVPLPNNDVTDIQNESGNTNEKEVITDRNKKLSSSSPYLAWLVSLILLMIVLWMYSAKNSLKSELKVASETKKKLEKQFDAMHTSLIKSEELLKAIRDNDIKVIHLAGQEIDSTAHAKIYWDKKEQKVFIDTQGLPEPPDGTIYQLWSLKLNPIQVTNIGILKDFITHDEKMFMLPNPNNSEGFGITLEPENGSETPTLDLLYTLGAVTY